MADDKKLVTLMNRGKRHFDVLNAEGKAVRHAPGATETYTLEQAAALNYPDLVDITKLPGQTDTAALKEQNIALASENRALKERLAALEAAHSPKPDAKPEPEPVAAGADEGGERGGKKRK